MSMAQWDRHRWGCSLQVPRSQLAAVTATGIPPGILVVAAAATLATAVAANEKYPVVSAWSSTMVDESRMMSQDSG